MQLPSITAAYLGILALLCLVLGLQVSRLRRGHRVLFGDGDNIKLRSAIRVHANFVEYVIAILHYFDTVKISLDATAVRLYLSFQCKDKPDEARHDDFSGPAPLRCVLAADAGDRRGDRAVLGRRDRPRRHHP
jgi:hypothetical protein